MSQTADLRIRTTKPLIAPGLLADDLPLDPTCGAQIDRARQEIAAILRGDDDRLVVVVGPCSIHDPAAALDYAANLKIAATHHAADLLVVMRVYFEKCTLISKISLFRKIRTEKLHFSEKSAHFSK